MQRESPTVLVVAAALCRDGHVLIAQRREGTAMAGLWEFPGGKVDMGEIPEAALVRELQEELAITVTDTVPLAFDSKKCDSFHLLLLLWSCVSWDGEPSGMEGQNLKWVRADDLDSYEMPDADRALLPQVCAFLAKE